MPDDQAEIQNSARPLTLAKTLAEELSHVRPERGRVAEETVLKVQRAGGDLAADWRNNFRRILSALFEKFRPLAFFFKSIYLFVVRLLHRLIHRPQPIPSAAVGEELSSVFRRLYNADLSAICFSGGGIRSATFALGIVEALAERRLLSKFDYLSTVSGGGYLGSWLSAWIRREQIETQTADLTRLRKQRNQDEAVAAEEIKVYRAYQEFRGDGVETVEERLNRHTPLDGDGFDPSIEPKQFQFLREYSNYMMPKVGLLSADSWTFVAIYLRNVFLNWTIFIPLITAALIAPWIMVAITLHAPLMGGALNTLLIIALAAGLAVLLVVILSLPSGGTDVSKPGWSTDGGVVLRGILPLLFMALTVVTLIYWKARPGNELKLPFSRGDTGYYFLIFAPAIAYLLLKVIVLTVRFV